MLIDLSPEQHALLYRHLHIDCMAVRYYLQPGMAVATQVPGLEAELAFLEGVCGALTAAVSQ